VFDSLRLLISESKASRYLTSVSPRNPLVHSLFSITSVSITFSLFSLIFAYEFLDQLGSAILESLRFQRGQTVHRDSQLFQTAAKEFAAT
jgi:hypothetical protein